MFPELFSLLRDSRAALFWDSCLSNFPPAKPVRRVRNAVRSQKRSTRAVLGSSRPGQCHCQLLFGDTGWPLSCSPRQPGARAQQHLGVRRVKVEEGQETFVQLPQHLIWARGRGESTQETSQSPHWSGTISASGQGTDLLLLQTTRPSRKVYNQI